MPKPAQTADPDATEAKRLAALQRYDILDTLPEAAFDSILRLAAQIFAAPIALVSFVDAERQWFKARIGLDLEQTPRAIAFCNAAILGTDVYEVPDAEQDPNFADNPLVASGPSLRFYAGAPLLTAEGLALGTVCVLDTQPRPPLTEAKRQALTDLAGAVMAQLELRRQLATRAAEMERAGLREQLLRIVAEAPSFPAAIDAAMSVLRDSMDSVICLFFRLAPDGQRLQLIGVQGSGSMGESAHFDRLRAMQLTIDNTAAGQALREDRQIIVEDLPAEALARWPAAALSAALGMGAMVLTPVGMASERCCMALGFAPDRKDLADIAEKLQQAAGALRPLLRRLRDAEETELFRRIVEASRDPVVVTDSPAGPEPKPTILYVNAAMLQETGFAPEALIGHPAAMLIGPETPQPAQQAIRTALATGQAVRQEILSQRSDGSVYWTDLLISPVTDAGGWQTHWASIRRDITQQHARTEALSESEAAFRELFHQHPAPMWVYDKASLAFLEVNEAAVVAYGWSREAFLRKTLLDIRPASEHARARAIAASTDPGLVVSGPWLHHTASGESRQVKVGSRRIAFHGHDAALAVIWDMTDRLRAETKASDLAKELRATFESFSDGLCSLSSDWRFTYVNREAERLLRRKAGDLIGEVIWHAFQGSLGTEAEHNYRAARDDGETRRFTHFCAPLETWFDITAYPAKDGLTVYFRDVTEQRQGAERLRLLEIAASKLNDIILITEAEPLDAPGPRTLFVNQAFERLTGYAAEDILGHSPRLLQGPKTDRMELNRIRQALKARRPIRSELLNYRKDGETVWLELDIVPVADANGHFTHFVSVERDITERKQAQIQLEQQAALLDQARDAIVVRGTDLKVQYWNRSAERLYGWTSAEVIGRSVLDLVYDEPEAALAATAAVLAEGEWSGQLTQRRRDGSRLVVDCAWTLLREADGSPRALLAVNTDITARLELEQRLRQAQRLEAVGQLTGGVAHDFNNLLTVILGNSEMLAESLAGDAELRQLADTNVAAAERGAALTRRLLAFSRQQMLDPKVIDVNRLMAGLEQMLRRTLGGNIEMELALAPRLWFARIDPPQLENAVLNLCINSRDAMPRGGRLTIETENLHFDADQGHGDLELAPGDYVLISVTDTGEGMTPEVAARAVEPFFTTKEVGQGSGLGLSMVFGFMKQSGGHLQIESVLGHGSAIRIYVPRAPAEEAETKGSAEAELVPGGSETILVVEDDALVRAHVAGLLRGLGYEVVVASQAAIALEVLGRIARIDLLFTDIVMPGGMDGAALAWEARLLRPGIPVLLASGYSQSGTMRAGRLDAGMVLLSKPYRRRELAEKIREVLAGRADMAEPRQAPGAGG